MSQGESWEQFCQLFETAESVSSLVAKKPSLSPGEAWKSLYEGKKCRETKQDSGRSGVGPCPLSQDKLQAIRKLGKWGPSDPSDLFLSIYYDTVRSIMGDLSGAVVSPSLMGSHGVAPMAIVSTIPDVVRHMSNLIVRAEKEVILATNYWQNGVAAKFIVDAIKELSRRAGDKHHKVVMKVLYDRGSPKTIFDPHYLPPESEYTSKQVALPAKHEIPNVDMEVMNYHQPVLGTFHSKFMIVDRKVALIQSNNIMDNDNLEMAVHLEGPIVDSIYDMALISWHKKMEPHLPCLATPASGLTTEDGIVPESTKLPLRNTLANDADHQASKSTNDAIWDAAFKPQQLACEMENLPEHTTDDPHYDSDIIAEAARVQASIYPRPGESRVDAIARHLNHTVNVGFPADPGAARDDNESHNIDHSNSHHDNHINAPELDIKMTMMTPYILTPMGSAASAPFPMFLASRPPRGNPLPGPETTAWGATAQNAAWLSAVRRARKTVYIQTPNLNAKPLLDAIVEACTRGVDVTAAVCLGYNDAGEMLPLQGGHNEAVAAALHERLAKLSMSSSSTSSSPPLAPTNDGVVEAQGSSPLAMVSSSAKENGSSINPTNSATILHAVSSVPTETLPRNVQNTKTPLSHLHWYWYVGRDQTRPLAAKPKKRRSCHVKLLIVDDEIAIVGSGNQDAQSWYHSQEANIVIGSRELCALWIRVLHANQNTFIFGAVDPRDGVWRDGSTGEGSQGGRGKQVEGSQGPETPSFAWAKGIVGAVKRARGEGGF